MKRLALFLLLVAGAALAHDGVHDAWFESLRVPATGGSCCNRTDCAFTDDWRITGAGYEVRHDGAWLAVPADVVLGTPSPTGRAAACIRAGRVICFVAGTLS